MATIKKGSYRFNDKLDFTNDAPSSFSFSFSIPSKFELVENENGETDIVIIDNEITQCNGINFSVQSGLLEYSIDGMPSPVYVKGEDYGEYEGWNALYLVALDIGVNKPELKGWGQTITVLEDFTPSNADEEAFATWFLANIEGNTPAVEITYKGEKIELYAGDVATLYIGGKKLTEDLVIKANEVAVPEIPETPETPETSDSPLPIEISTAAEMDAILKDAEIGSVYKYTGTTGFYENGALYVVEERE